MLGGWFENLWARSWVGSLKRMFYATLHCQCLRLTHNWCLQPPLKCRCLCSLGNLFFHDISSFVKLFPPQNSVPIISCLMLWLGHNRNSTYWLIFNESLLYTINNFQCHLRYLNCLLRVSWTHKLRQSPIATGTHPNCLVTNE